LIPNNICGDNMLSFILGIFTGVNLGVFITAIFVAGKK